MVEAQKAHIFLCDDDRGIIEVTRLILEDHYHVHVYYRGDNLIEDVQRVKPAAVLLDLWMPGEGGEAIARKLKSNSLTEHIPVVLFSAANNIEKVAAAINADAYIAKPFDITDMLGVLDRCISAAAAK